MAMLTFREKDREIVDECDCDGACGWFNYDDNSRVKCLILGTSYFAKRRLSVKMSVLI